MPRMTGVLLGLIEPSLATTLAKTVKFFAKTHKIGDFFLNARLGKVKIALSAASDL